MRTEFENTEDLRVYASDPDNWVPCKLKTYEAVGFYAPIGVTYVVNHGERIFTMRESETMLVLEGESCFYSIDTVLKRFNGGISRDILKDAKVCQRFELTRKANDKTFYCLFVPVNWRYGYVDLNVNKGNQLNHGKGDFLVWNSGDFKYDNMKLYTGYHFKHCFEVPDCALDCVPSDEIDFSIQLKM
jgi:hypothetical protein